MTKNFTVAGNQTPSPSDSLLIRVSPRFQNIALRIVENDIEGRVKSIMKVLKSAIPAALGFDREGWN
ncbi:hypothetical protein [Streptomyces sp. BK239]|uniref:hypothetical protein n=1 Tax=Streptomyces sp. BK239 TaxID=2512155 RepID=UPI001A921DCD|nr:hypothetical protein [Streptomyces sp. BK239]